MTIPPYVALFIFTIIVGLFFWSVYKAVKTQNTLYALGLLPFILLLAWMFFI